MSKYEKQPLDAGNVNSINCTWASPQWWFMFSFYSLLEFWNPATPFLSCLTPERRTSSSSLVSMWFSVAVDPPTSGADSTAWATPSSMASNSYPSLALHVIGSARPFIVLLNRPSCDPRQQSPSHMRHRTRMRSTRFAKRWNHQVPTTCATTAFMARLSQSKPSQL